MCNFEVFPYFLSGQCAYNSNPISFLHFWIKKKCFHMFWQPVDKILIHTNFFYTFLQNKVLFFFNFLILFIYLFFPLFNIGLVLTLRMIGLQRVNALFACNCCSFCIGSSNCRVD